MYVMPVGNPTLSYDDNSCDINSQRSMEVMEQESVDDDDDDDEDIEEIMQDGLRRAKIARERLEREEFLQVRIYVLTYMHEYTL